MLKYKTGKAVNAKVVYITGRTVHDVSEAYDRSWAYCKWFVANNRKNIQYSNGVLKVVSADLTSDRILHAKAKGYL